MSLQSDFLAKLHARFEKYPNRHPSLQWSAIQEKLLRFPAKIQTLEQMEATGGEPDVIGQDSETGEFLFCDCSDETPKGRRSLCYDQEARLSRKENAPQNSALELAQEMGIEILTEAEYRFLQTTGVYDTKTSSWLLTPPSIRSLGGAIFGDYRYGQVFVYHNGVQSYYAARGFRGMLKV